MRLVKTSLCKKIQEYGTSLANGSYIRANTAGIYLLKFSYGNDKKMCKICSKLAIKTPERGE